MLWQTDTDRGRIPRDHHQHHPSGTDFHSRSVRSDMYYNPRPSRRPGPTLRHTAPRTAPAWPTPLQVSKTPEETIPHNVRLGEESRTVEVEVVRTESILFYAESSLPRTGCREFKYDSNSTCAASISSFFFRCFRDRSSSIKWSITTAVVQRSSCRAMGKPNCS